MENIRFFFDTGASNDWRKGFVFKALYGRGAGYIGCFTFFIAWRSGKREWLQRHRNIKWPALDIRFTKNANRVPYMMH